MDMEEKLHLAQERINNLQTENQLLKSYKDKTEALEEQKESFKKMLEDQFTHAQKSMDQTDELERVKEENSQLKHDILHLK